MISFIIPTHNEAAWLPHHLAALRASLRATGLAEDTEIIVVDAGSNDGTPNIAAANGARVITTDTCQRAHQLNRGAREATGDTLVFVHADTLVSPRWLRALVDSITPATRAGWSEIEILVEAPTRDSDPLGLAVMERGINWRTRRFVSATGDQGLFVDRELFEQVGGFPEQPILEANALARRLRRHTNPAILEVPLRISGRRWQRRGIFRTMVLMWTIRGLDRIGTDPESLAEMWANA
jgi:rSAM/selenodomain-associated transferase 2